MRRTSGQRVSRTRLTEWVELHLQRALVTRSLEAEVEAADAGEQANKMHLLVRSRSPSRALTAEDHFVHLLSVVEAVRDDGERARILDRVEGGGLQRREVRPGLLDFDRERLPVDGGEDIWQAAAGESAGGDGAGPGSGLVVEPPDDRGADRTLTRHSVVPSFDQYGNASPSPSESR